MWSGLSTLPKITNFAIFLQCLKEEAELFLDTYCMQCTHAMAFFESFLNPKNLSLHVV